MEIKIVDKDSVIDSFKRAAAGLDGRAELLGEAIADKWRPVLDTFRAAAELEKKGFSRKQEICHGDFRLVFRKTMLGDTEADLCRVEKSNVETYLSLKPSELWITPETGRKAFLMADETAIKEAQWFAESILGEIKEKTEEMERALNMLRTPEQELREKFQKWAGGFAADDDVWTDYNGTTEQTEWAIDNEVSVDDYNTWQAVQRVLRHEVPFDKAMKISLAIYDAGISVYDCE